MTNQVRTALREKVGQQSSFLAPAVILLLAIADLLPVKKKKKAIKANSVKIVMDSGEEIDVTKHVTVFREARGGGKNFRLGADFGIENQVSLTALAFGIPDELLNPPQRTALVNTPFATDELEDLVVYYFGIKLNMDPGTQFEVFRSETYRLDVREVLPYGAGRFLGSFDLARQTVGYVVDGNPDNLRWEGFDPGYTPAESYRLGGVGPAVRSGISGQARYMREYDEYSRRRDYQGIYSQRPMMAFGLCGPSRITYSAGAGPDPRCDCSQCRSN